MARFRSLGKPSNEISMGGILEQTMFDYSRGYGDIAESWHPGIQTVYSKIAGEWMLIPSNMMIIRQCGAPKRYKLIYNRM